VCRFRPDWAWSRAGGEQSSQPRRRARTGARVSVEAERGAASAGRLAYLDRSNDSLEDDRAEFGASELFWVKARSITLAIPIPPF
jgi:hypothetical protein